MASFNELLERGTKFVGDIADDVIHSSTFKTVIPGKEAWAKEFHQTVNSNQAIKSSLAKQRIALETNIPESLLNKETADKAIAQASKMTESGFENASKIIQDSGKSQEEAEKIVNIMKKKGERILSEEIDTDNLSFLQKAPSYARAYFSNPDKKVVNTRIAAAAGTYAGAAVAGRYLSGGTLTSDNYGQKDIAGIPFI